MLRGTWCRFDVRNAHYVSLCAHEGLFLYQGSFRDRSYESNKSSGSNLCSCWLVAQTQVICTCVHRVARSGVVHSNGHISPSIGRMDLVLSALGRAGRELSGTASESLEKRSSHELCHFEVGQQHFLHSLGHLKMTPRVLWWEFC